MDRLSIVIPSYNEEEVLPITIPELHNLLQKLIFELFKGHSLALYFLHLSIILHKEKSIRIPHHKIKMFF